MNSRHSVLAFLLLAAAGAAALVAGPLDPPAGPIGPTFKTLSEVEPRVALGTTTTPGDADSVFKITQPGSYYLTGNLAGEGGKHGIEIATGGVTLDLMGFELVGVPGSLDGVNVSPANLTSIAVMNGAARSWGGDGIDLGSSGATRLVDLRCSGNGFSGLRCAGNAVVTGCTSRQNGGVGFFSGNGSVIGDCTSSNNGTDGYELGVACSVSDSVATFNLGNGFTVSAGSSVVRCTARQNTLDGIRVTNECHVRENTCSGNGNGAGDGAGIHVTSLGNRIESNFIAGGDRGLDVDVLGNFIARNTVTGSTVRFDVVAGNVGLFVSATSGGAVVGSSGGTSVGTTDPYANVSY